MYDRFDELVEYITSLIDGKTITADLRQRVSMMVNLRFECNRRIFLDAWEQAFNKEK